MAAIEYKDDHNKIAYLGRERGCEDFTDILRDINEFFLESDEEEQIGLCTKLLLTLTSDDELIAEDLSFGVETVSESASSPPRSRSKHLGVRSDDFLWDKLVEDFFSSESESNDDMENYISPLPYGYRRQKYFTYLKELLPHVYREDLLLLHRRMNRLTVPPSYCRDVVVAGNIIQTVQAGLRQAYECIASAPIACTARQMVFSSPWLTAKKESGSPLQTALVCNSNPLMVASSCVYLMLLFWDIASTVSAACIVAAGYIVSAGICDAAGSFVLANPCLLYLAVTFTYPNPNSSASPSFTQDDTSESFIPEPTQPMPTFTQTAFSQPAVNYQQVQPNQSIFSQHAIHFQQTQPTQTNQTGEQYPQNPNDKEMFVSADYVPAGHDETFYVLKEFIALIENQLNKKVKGISQDKYVKDMPTKFDMESVRTATTPYEAAKTKLKDETDPPINVHLYRSMIVQEIFKYLKGHQNSACGTLKDSPFQLVCLQVTLIMLVLMVIGIHIQVGVNFWAEVISWQCKEAGLIVVLLQEASMLCCLLLWPGTLGFRNQFAGLWNQLHEYQSLIANQSTICIVKNPVFLSGPSILRLGNHFYRDANEKKNVIQVLKILTDVDMVFCGILFSCDCRVRVPAVCMVSTVG
ncbi:hypothetical protein Tco_0542231 [Tanacetum coccineum]